ncbi:MULTISPECIES: glycosyltransferase family 4 protein [Alcanivorax]|jgi:UDP-glucose:(heptosyl)LPS alpha-1,3-glucosyltransferase|nr:glycosyltransferase family 4 protein [Alcanivorax jadensis]MDF1638393.1 glycosyltransferase family 4 protein [Alcanivorax jadensis]|tara:strand:- start:360 stop:1484 length:1125 start_codon:yes stop_codon:yes gene_type:complete
MMQQHRTVAFALFRYFPYGGLQRDFLRVAELCVQAGHSVEVLTTDWDGPRPEWLKVTIEKVTPRSNHAAMVAFGKRAQKFKQSVNADVLMVFNRVPGGDLYFAADDCFAVRVMEKNAFTRLLPRYRTYLRLEQQLFSSGSHTRILFLNNSQRDDYLGEYDLPESRYRVLPPGVRNDRRPGDNAEQLRAGVRQEFSLADSESLLLFLGSDFRRKGLGRALQAIASLPDPEAVKLLVVGEDDSAPFVGDIERLGLSDQVIFAGARDDVPALLQGADLLIHPASHEAAGMVLVESLVAGLPILTTAACGYASYVRESKAGQVVDSPFRQEQLDQALADMLSGKGGHYRQAALDYAERVDLFGMHQQVLEEIEALLNS